MKAAGEKTPLACHVQFRGGCSPTTPPPTPGSSGERLPHPPGPGSREGTEAAGAKLSSTETARGSIPTGGSAHRGEV